MKPSEFRQFAVKALPRGRRIMTEGKPGVGKTTLWMEVCEILGWDFIGISMPLEDPSTIRGYPSRGTDGRAHHCLFDGIARAMDATKPTFLLADDMGMAGESTAKAFLRFAQFGEIDGRKLPEHVVIGAATNDIGHGAGVFGLIEPLKSRFHTIVTIETSIDDVVGYGLSRNWPAWLLAYIRNVGEPIFDWKPSKSMHNDGATPRTLEYVAEWDNEGFDDPEVWAGAIGKGRAGEASNFKRLINDLPDIDAVLLDPDTAPVPDNPSAKLLVAMSLAVRLTAGNFGQVVTYLKRLPQPLRAYSLRDAMRAENEKRQRKILPPDHKAITASRDFTAWACSADGKDILSATA